MTRFMFSYDPNLFSIGTTYILKRIIVYEMIRIMIKATVFVIFFVPLTSSQIMA